jgi:hypothetical protein
MHRLFLTTFFFFLVLQVLLLGIASGMETQKTDMVILLDRSGSMDWESGDPRGLSRSAVEFLLDQLELANPENRAVLVLFASDVNIVPEQGLTSNLDVIRARLDEVKVTSGDTDLEMAITAGLKLLAQSTATREIVMISDGQPDPDPRNPDARVMERFPKLYEKFHEAGSEKLQAKVRSQIQSASMDNIERAQFGALKEADIEVYPIGLSGIQELGEELLRKMALQVTSDAGAFKKVKGNDMVSALDQIVPKPESLINIKRDAFKGGGSTTWSTSFQLDWNLELVRILILYDKKPPEGVSWQLRGPGGMIDARRIDGGYLAARDRNGDGELIFERVFLNNPLTGDYSLSVESSRFLEPFRVIIEGRTKARIIIRAEPDPAEAGLPVDLFTTLEDDEISLSDAKVNIVNESGMVVATIDDFSPGKDKILKADWVPQEPGLYKMKITGYIDPQKEKYLGAQRQLIVKPKQAVNLRVIIPTP